MPVERTVIEWQMTACSREVIRTEVLVKWAMEICGSATAYQRYRYNVETLLNGTRIYLHRPAWKNKGCDFEVWCEEKIIREDGRRQGRPSHNDLISELIAIACARPEYRDATHAAVLRVWRCENVEAVCSDFLPHLLNEEWQLRADRALKIAKWLFIEQDITDWNTSGRRMLLTGFEAALAGTVH